MPLNFTPKVGGNSQDRNWEFLEPSVGHCGYRLPASAGVANACVSLCVCLCTHLRAPPGAHLHLCVSLGVWVRVRACVP